MKRAVIITGGDAPDEKTLKSLAESADIIICCDSGQLSAKECGVVPSLVIGDFDSSEYDIFGDDVKKLKFPSKKDFTDTHLAFNYATDEGYDDIVIAGGLGGRCDHSLANLSLFSYAYEKKIKLKIVTDKNTVVLLSEYSPFFITKDEAKDKYVAVLPMGAYAEGLEIKGFKYEIADYTLSGFDNLCVSNEVVCDKAQITVTDGFAFVLLCEKN